MQLILSTYKISIIQTEIKVICGTRNSVITQVNFTSSLDNRVYFRIGNA